MSSQVYFGKCINSTSDAQVKEVTMVDMPDKFNEGDLLAVFFTNRNTAAAPSIKIVTGSTQQEVSTADDIGIFIKSHDVDVDKEGLWGNGETVLFCFVQNPEGTQGEEGEEGIIYLELIGKLQASNEDYGIVKLNGIAETQSFEDWLNDDDTTDDYNSAISVATLKSFVNALLKPQETTPGGDDSGDTPAAIQLGLLWEPNAELGEDLTSLGLLSLSSTGQMVSIGIPSNVLNPPNEITYTGQLRNNGSAGTDVDGEPYITRNIPNDLFFVAGDEITPSTSPRTFEAGNGIALGNPNLSRTETKNGEVVDRPENQLPYHIRFDNDKLVLGYDQGEAFNQVLVRPALNVEGTVTTTNTIDASAQINGTRIYGGSSKPTWAGADEPDNYSSATIISEGDIYEQNDLLKNRYSPKLKTMTLVSDVISIPFNRMARFKISWPTSAETTNWKPIGIIGYNIDAVDTQNPNDGLWSNVWELFVVYDNQDHNLADGKINDVQAAIMNLHPSKSLKIKLKVRLLCMRTDIGE